MSTDTNPDPELDVPTDPKDDAAEANAGTGRFAVYDKDELRFRGAVHDTRKAADAHKGKLSEPKGVRRGRFEVREV